MSEISTKVLDHARNGHLDLRGLSATERDARVNEAVAVVAGIPKLFVLRKPCYDPCSYYHPNARGYTSRISEAWQVTEEEGRKHVTDPRLPDRVVMEPMRLPPYATSCDAVRPVEAALTQKTRAQYETLLVKEYGVPCILYASALDRCISLLRANGWEISE